jgi:hypothetical protein
VQPRWPKLVKTNGNVTVYRASELTLEQLAQMTPEHSVRVGDLFLSWLQADLPRPRSVNFSADEAVAIAEWLDGPLRKLKALPPVDPQRLRNTWDFHVNALLEAGLPEPAEDSHIAERFRNGSPSFF